MKLNTEEQRKKDAIAFLNCQVKAQTLLRKKFNSIPDIFILSGKKVVQMCGIIEWCELLDMQYVREDWDGNEHCHSNWDVVYFDFKGIRFFELVDKIDKGENS